MSVATVPFQMTEICRKVITLYVFFLKIEVHKMRWKRAKFPKIVILCIYFLSKIMIMRSWHCFGKQWLTVSWKLVMIWGERLQTYPKYVFKKKTKNTGVFVFWMVPTLIWPKLSRMTVPWYAIMKWNEMKHCKTTTCRGEKSQPMPFLFSLNVGNDNATQIFPFYDSFECKGWENANAMTCIAYKECTQQSEWYICTHTKHQSKRPSMLLYYKR